MPFANINGVKLNYELHGTREPLVLVHGYTGTSRTGGTSCRRSRSRTGC
jgi:pimeloyl-ACP methyl ester carboxylesterase